MIGRARLQHTPAGLSVIIPAFWQDRFLSRVLLRPIATGFGVWCLWRLYPDSVFFTIFNVFIVAIIATQLAWRALGQEIVTVDRTALTLRIEVAGFGWTRFNALAWVSGLRLGEVRIGARSSGYGFLYFDYDSQRPWTETMLSVMAALCFYGYNPRRPRLAKGLSEAECRALMQVMVEYAGADLRVQRLKARRLAETLP